MAQTYLMLLWHMHQPFYKDLAEDRYVMPWARLHALKDYWGMVAVLREFPSVHVTFNLVPSLVAQIEDYAKGTANELAYEVAFKPAEKLTAADQENLLTQAFQANQNLLGRFPRFRELEEKAAAAAGQRPRTAARLTTQDLRDLQVLSQLAWLDEIYLAGDKEVRALVLKARGYSEADKKLVHNKEIELFKATLEEYRSLSARGQIEVSTSPFYHPILPLLCDTNIASESHPGVSLPRRRFRHPEDARAQLRQAIAFHERVFGSRPRGLWPSEGSVSDEALTLAASEGFVWAATDEGVLGRSLQMGFYRQPDGTVTGGHELYRPQRFQSRELGGPAISIFFRDHQLSDLVGFVYSQMEPLTAARDLYQRIRAAGRSTGGRSSVVSVILDGENCWEHYPGNGRDFLKSFYGLVAGDPDLKAVTASEALEAVPPGILTHVVPGSWINANFDVWIGAEEDNKAWDLLSEARDFFAQRTLTEKLSAAKLSLAQEEVWIAEGSDWCWWYGPEHSSALDEEFDYLFRKHLSNVYRMLDAPSPDELAEPLKRSKGRPVNVPPSGPVEPKIDGRVTSYFEWMGAGVYTPDFRSGSMHGGSMVQELYIEALYYGHSERGLYLRLDLSEAFLKEGRDFEIRTKVDAKNPVRLNTPVTQGRLGEIEFWKGQEQSAALPAGQQLQVALDRVFELRLDYALLGLSSQDQVRLQISLWVRDLPVQVIPQEGWLTLELTKDLPGW
jgi:alpha-amylase/alpha-mannosidase (GH57 family)